MEPECSWPHSQEQSTCLYLHPERSIRHLHTIYQRSTLILFSRRFLHLTSGIFLPGFLHQISPYTSYPPIRSTCSAHQILRLLQVLIYNSWELRVRIKAMDKRILKFWNQHIFLFNALWTFLRYGVEQCDVQDTVCHSSRPTWVFVMNAALTGVWWCVTIVNETLCIYEFKLWCFEWRQSTVWLCVSPSTNREYHTGAAVLGAKRKWWVKLFPFLILLIINFRTCLKTIGDANVLNINCMLKYLCVMLDIIFRINISYLQLLTLDVICIIRIARRNATVDLLCFATA
jgi:hypothetical protein